MNTTTLDFAKQALLDAARAYAAALADAITPTPGPDAPEAPLLVFRPTNTAAAVREIIGKWPTTAIFTAESLTLALLPEFRDKVTNERRRNAKWMRTISAVRSALKYMDASCAIIRETRGTFRNHGFHRAETFAAMIPQPGSKHPWRGKMVATEPTTEDYERQKAALGIEGAPHPLMKDNP